MHYGINMIVFGPQKSGKSWLGDTTPAPRLVLDAEGGSRFTSSSKVMWDPLRSAPPTPDGSWETAIVYVRDYRTVLKVLEWLDSGKHPFRSVVVDSISEVQQRCIDDISGINQMQQTQWGELLRKVSSLARNFRDLTMNAVRPLDAVVLIAMTKENNGIQRPFVQGSLADTLPYYYDICALMKVVPSDDGLSMVRRLFVGPVTGFETGERVGGRLGSHIDNPNVTEMLARVRGCSIEDVLETTKKEPK
jgi:hypothetical protein